MNPRNVVLSFIIYLTLFTINFAQAQKEIKLDSLEVAAFLDSLITETMQNQNVPGCAVVVVKDSSILFSNGYGFSDIENQIPVDPKKTLFRTASVCKTVTGTVVLVARDEGLVDMNTDVNKYLTSFKVPDNFGKPITLKNLLTHTAGFDDIYIHKSALRKEEGMPLGEFLAKYIPERITPPGEVMSYSNLSNALAAFVVEEVSGKDFEEYAIEKLFKPLEMKTSSYTLHESQKDNLYKGYLNVDGNLIEFPFDYLNDYPAGQMLSSVNEFANFMIMHLNHGLVNGKQVLDSSTVAEIHSVQFSHHSKLKRATGYAFGIGETNGLISSAHGGGYVGISSLMYLFPEIKLGFYIVVNTASGLPGITASAFMNKFYPETRPQSNTELPLTDLPYYDRNVDKFIGKYRLTRYSRNQITKAGVLTEMLGSEMPVWKNEDGMIMMYDHMGRERRMIQIEPLFFQSVDDDYYMAFHKDENGDITHVFTDGTTSLEKVEVYETISFNQILFYVLMAVFSINVIIFFIYAFIKRKDSPKNVTYRLLKASFYVSALYSSYFILLGVAMMFFVNPAELQMGFAYGMPWYFYPLQLIPFIGIVFTVLLIWKLVISFKVFSKVKFGFTISTIVFISSLLMIWFLNYWQLLGWSF